MPPVDKEGRQVHVRRVGEGARKGTVGEGERAGPEWQVGPNWVWEEDVRGQERGSMARPTTMVSRAMVESSGGQGKGWVGLATMTNCAC